VAVKLTFRSDLLLTARGSIRERSLSLPICCVTRVTLLSAPRAARKGWPVGAIQIPKFNCASTIYATADGGYLSPEYFGNLEPKPMRHSLLGQYVEVGFIWHS
jgi:hypothetical protein